MRSPLIVQISQKELDRYQTTPDAFAERFYSVIRSEPITVPVVLHLDHTKDFSIIQAAIEAGELPTLGHLMNLNQLIKEKLGLSVPKTHTGKVQRRKLQPLFDAFRGYNGPPCLVSSEALPGNAPDSAAGGRSGD